MNAEGTSQLHQAIVERLRRVIDPETNVDVIRMRLVDDLIVGSDGQVHYTFRPSSPFCPIAVYLSKQIKQAVADVPGVTGQWINVTGYFAAKDLEKLINQEIT